MRKWIYFASLVCIALLVISTAFITPVPVLAIGEVTPTPAPEEANESVPDDVDVVALIEEALEDIQAGEFRSALAKMDIVIDVNDSIPTAYYLRGVAASQLGFIDDAIDDFSSAIELAPWRFDLYIFRGDAYRLNGSLADALLDYDEAVSINPFLPGGFLRRSDIFFELGDDAAGDVDDLIARALSARANGELTESLAFFDEAIAIGEGLENVGIAYYLRAIASLSLGDTDAVFEDYAMALEINPDLHNVYLARGILYREQGNIKAAGRDFINRMRTLANETIEADMAIGEITEFDMAYRRVYEISFEGTAGQVITISANDDENTIVDPLIALLDPDGEAIAGDDDFGGVLDSLIDEFELPDDGTYTLVLSHAGGGSSVGYIGFVEVSING